MKRLTRILVDESIQLFLLYNALYQVGLNNLIKT